MKFALFYEIPVARPWTPGKEHQAYKNTIEQAVLGEKMGFHAFWTVEHHFLEEFSHCSNPEVLYGGRRPHEHDAHRYGVRLSKPYNHPIRTASRSQCSTSFPMAASTSDRPLVDARNWRLRRRARRAREMWREALGHIVSAWTRTSTRPTASTGRWARSVGYSRSSRPHPPIFGATSSMPGHKEMGKQGIGLCSFTVGLPPEMLANNIAMYREGLAECTQTAGKFLNDTAATFTMVHCAPTSQEATEVAKESFEWYPSYGGGLIASVAEWQEERGRTDDLDTYQYTADMLARKREGVMSHITIDYLRDSGSAVMGDPDQCIASAKKYEEVGCDLLLCLVNPLKIPHEQVMQSIELMGKYVLPEFK